MKFFTNKSVKFKMIISIVFVLVLTFSLSTISNAGAKDKIGEMLLNAIQWIVLTVGDAVVFVLHLFFSPGTGETLVEKRWV